MSFDQLNLNGYTQVYKALEMLNDLYSQYNSEISYAEYSQLHDAISSICEVGSMKEKGKWVQSDLDCEFVTCSYCKEHEIEGRRAFRPDYADTMNFCMICGADMRERSEEE